MACFLLGNLEPSGYESMALRTVYEMACFLVLAVVVGRFGGRRSGETRSDKFQQFTFVVGVLVQKTAEFSQAQVGCPLRAQHLFDSGYMFCVSSGCFRTCHTFIA